MVREPIAAVAVSVVAAVTAAARGVRGPASVVLTDSLPTLLGETIDVRFLELVDKDPDLRDPYLFVPGINKRASNGVIA